MDLDSLTPVDHARRYAMLLASSVGTFVFIAIWMALNWNFFVAVLIGVATGDAGVLSFSGRSTPAVSAAAPESPANQKVSGAGPLIHPHQHAFLTGRSGTLRPSERPILPQ